MVQPLSKSNGRRGIMWKVQASIGRNRILRMQSVPLRHAWLFVEGVAVESMIRSHRAEPGESQFLVKGENQ
jgi:hypothetical protein